MPSFGVLQIQRARLESLCTLRKLQANLGMPQLPPHVLLFVTLECLFRCVTPFIIVPGDWTAAQLDYVAQHVVGAIVANNSFNCNAAKVLVTDKNWKLRDKFFTLIKAELGKQPSRVAWYPGASNRYKAFLEHYPKAEALGAAPTESTHIPWTLYASRPCLQPNMTDWLTDWLFVSFSIPDIPQKAGEYALCNEPFCPIISETSIDGKDAADFMKQATDFCNDKVCFISEICTPHLAWHIALWFLSFGVTYPAVYSLILPLNPPSKPNSKQCLSLSATAALQSTLGLELFTPLDTQLGEVRKSIPRDLATSYTSYFCQPILAIQWRTFKVEKEPCTTLSCLTTLKSRLSAFLSKCLWEPSCRISPTTRRPPNHLKPCYTMTTALPSVVS